jgi:hypothetical protein
VEHASGFSVWKALTLGLQEKCQVIYAKCEGNADAVFALRMDDVKFDAQ